LHCKMLYSIIPKIYPISKPLIVLEPSRREINGWLVGEISGLYLDCSA
jgi:hypothetical protein